MDASVDRARCRTAGARAGRRVLVAHHLQPRHHPLQCVVAMDNEPLPATHRWSVNGWYFIEPKGCKTVIQTSFGTPAYIGFGYYDARKQFGAGIIDQVPDIGFLQYNWVQAAMYRKSRVPVLTKANKRLCVSHSPAGYTLNDSPETNCSTLHPQGSTAQSPSSALFRKSPGVGYPCGLFLASKRRPASEGGL